MVSEYFRDNIAFIAVLFTAISFILGPVSLVKVPRVSGNVRAWHGAVGKKITLYRAAERRGTDQLTPTLQEMF